MANVIIPNQALSTSYVSNTSAATVDLYFVMWKLTRAMKKAGWKYLASTTAASKDTSGIAANDQWGGNADPATDLYSAFPATAVWWIGQGPSTLKIPIGAASTGTLIRGEDISQTTTGAHGELQGYLWDAITSQGYLVVAPRVDGSGADPHGWDHSNVITGAISGATVTPNATVKEYVREVLFWKSNLTNDQTRGNIYYQCLDAAAEGTSRFSYLAANAAGVTFAVAPGGGGTANSFPTIGSFVVIGTSNDNSLTGTTWPNRWVNHSATSNQCHVVAVNATYSSNVTADGSFWAAIGTPAVLGTDNGLYDGLVFTAVDNAEPGEIDPYVWYMPTNDATYSTNGAVGSQTAANVVFCAQPSGSTNTLVYRMLRARGMTSTTDTFTTAGQGMVVPGSQSSFSLTSTVNSGDRETLACTFNTTYLLEDIWVAAMYPFVKCRKGTLRWMKAVAPGGNASGTDTFGGLSWIQVSNVTATNVGPPYILGPWDGSTVPVSTH